MDIIRKSIWNIFAAIAGCIIALVILEFIIQKAEIVSPSFVDVDEKIGTVFRPNKSLVTFKEGFYMGGTNDFGYLGPAYPPSKREGTFRIALIGDSYVEGFQLFDRYHFRTVLENELHGISTTDVEVLNFGRSGFSLPDMYCYFRNFVDSFHPDVILFFVHATDLNTVNQSFGPRCVLENGKLKMNFGFNKSESFLFRDRTDFYRGKLSLLSLASNCQKLYDEGLIWQILLDKLYINYLREDLDPEDKHNPSVGLSTLDSAIIMDLEGINYGYTEHIVMVVNMGLSPITIDTIENLGLVVLNPISALEQLERNGINPHYWKATGKVGHWNHAANRAVGNYLAREIEKIISAGNR